MREVETLLLRYDFVLARISGSHHIFEYDDGERFEQVIVPLHGRKVKRIYVEKAVEIIDALFPSEEIDDEEDSSGE
jgi:predicted RNA binding protein YcfA (HicA-like mRNA interferase family)